MESIFGVTLAYKPPAWLIQPGGVALGRIPAERISLGRFPTPLQKVVMPEDRFDLDWWVKRDDLSSFDLSGNKVRKLEFLLYDAKEQQCDSVVTIGGEQSNHCRATAVAARQIGLDPHLILRRPSGSTEELGLVGNILLDRMVGSKIYTVSTGTYMQMGSTRLIEELAVKLREEGKKPYVIPVGGSNVLGAFGYISCAEEIIAQSQAHSLPFDHIVVACGSGGTLAGLVIGMRLAGIPSMLHIVGVCDTPDIFYDHLHHVAEDLGIDFEKFGPVRSWCHIYSGQGIGYARSTEDELQYLLKVSRQTGIALDPVYSGKGLYHFVKRVMVDRPELFEPKQRALFIHTGGVLGLYDKLDQLSPFLPESNGDAENSDVIKLLSVLNK